jgi:hypothetical protein
MTANEVIVKSPIASAMGATVSVTGPGRSMYLVIGRSVPLDPIVKTAGGKVVIRFNGQKMLVTLPFSGYLSLRSSHQISQIGPVTVDTKKLARVAEMLAPKSGPGPGAAG